MNRAPYNVRLMGHFYHLSRFENIARELIEGSFDRVLGRPQIADNISRKLAKAIDENQDGQTVTGTYTVYLHPEEYDILESEFSELSSQLSELVVALADDMNLELAEITRISFDNDPDCTLGQVRVEANSEINLQSTRVRAGNRNDLVAASIKAADAFLIINGKRHVSLNKPIFSIGRQLNNDIVLDERTVSRLHAQIRWRYGRFILFDLGSSAGTLVNGEPIEECVLKPGDVIMLGNATIIFGFEEQEYQQPGKSHDSADGWTRELIRNADKLDDQE